jgi:hypothetical protein
MLGRIGKPVNFKFPANEKSRSGKLVDRAVVRSIPGTKGVQYWDVFDLITFQNTRSSEWIRIGYYRVSKGRLQWGSQTTITEPVKIWKRVLIKAAKQKPWLRDLLISVVAEVKK